jgi:hypothetical protein
MDYSEISFLSEPECDQQFSLQIWKDLEHQMESIPTNRLLEKKPDHAFEQYDYSKDEFLPYDGSNQPLFSITEGKINGKDLFTLVMHILGIILRKYLCTITNNFLLYLTNFDYRI